MDYQATIQKQKELQGEYLEGPDRFTRIGNLFKRYIQKANLPRDAKVLEIGGRKNSYREFLGFSNFTNLDLSQTDDQTLVADITHCPEIPDASYDLILSVDVFEHIDRPWKAAEEITRILKPGGLTCHSTLFSWRYHPCPIDYWRFTPEALKFLFSDLNPLHADFDTTERRRNVVGKNKNKLKEDAFGGWRENWRVDFIGKITK